MKSNDKYLSCKKIFDSICSRNKLTEAIVYIDNSAGDLAYSMEYNRTIDSKMNLASITKLFVTTCIMQLIEEKKLELTSNISKFLDAKIMKGLHIYKGKDYSNTLTIYDLLFQRSGLPDYYFSKHSDGVSYEKMIFQHDTFIPFEEMISVSKSMKPIFEPRHPGRSYYADINFDLLGKIIENIEHNPLYKVFEQRIFAPLNLTNTYVVSDEKNESPIVYIKGKPHSITQFLKSCPASGGGVTTAKEFMIFMKAFWGGKLFNIVLFDLLKEHNKLQLIYGSIEYSGGHMYINAGYPFIEKSELRGHSGATGSFAYYNHKDDIFYVGDLNDNRVYIPVNMVLRMDNICR